MNDPTRVFVILSGEHPTLPLAEMSAILDANRIPFKIAESFFKLVEIDADIHAVKTIADRGAFMDEVGEEIVHSGPTLDEIDDAVKSSDLPRDRKSTRLNSSHSQISYAVFCLKKKKKTNTTNIHTTILNAEHH